MTERSGMTSKVESLDFHLRKQRCGDSDAVRASRGTLESLRHPRILFVIGQNLLYRRSLYYRPRFTVQYMSHNIHLLCNPLIARASGSTLLTYSFPQKVSF